MKSFLHLFISEAHCLMTAHVLSLGGHILVNYKLRKCVVMENNHKNQVSSVCARAKDSPLKCSQPFSSEDKMPKCIAQTQDPLLRVPNILRPPNLGSYTPHNIYAMLVGPVFAQCDRRRGTATERDTVSLYYGPVHSSAGCAHGHAHWHTQ